MQRRILAVGNQKGGVGKTTTALNLGAELVARGRSVVLVDADPQHSLTTSLGVDAADRSLAEVLGDHEAGRLTVKDVIVKANGFWLVPSDLQLASNELGLERRWGRETLLKRALASVTADYVLIDCPPSLGLMTVNALVAADGVLIPVQAEFLSMRGLTLFLRTLEGVRQELNPGLRVLGVLPTMTRKTTHHGGILETLKGSLAEGRVFTEIPQSIRASEAHAAGWPVARLDKDNAVAEAYRKLALEVDIEW